MSSFVSSFARSLPLGQAAFCLTMLSVSACDDAKPKDDPAAAAKQEAAKIWEARCVNCHGAQGKGDGPGAATLDPKPRSFADPAWQGTASDEQITQIILEGGMGVQMSPSMPANPDLESKPDVVKQLVMKIRLMQQ